MQIPGGARGGMVMDEIDTWITSFKVVVFNMSHLHYQSPFPVVV